MGPPGGPQPLNPQVAARHLATALEDLGEPTRSAQQKRYLKSDLTHLGVPVPAIRRVIASFARDHSDLDRSALIAVVSELWGAPVHEHRMAAVELLDRYGSILRPGDLRLVERLIRESKTWALVDPLAINVAGGLVERFPHLATRLDRWAADPDDWIRRSALLALLVPLRRGAGDFERFARYADALLEERAFFIRKAIGWVLRDTAKRRPDLVTRWLRPRVSRASGVTVREAVKYLPARDREAILRAHRS